MGKKVKAITLMFLTAIIWGFAFVAQKVESLGPLSFSGIRFLLGAFCLLPVVLAFERKRDKLKKAFLYSLFGGTVLAVAANLQQLGINITKSAGKSSFLTALYIMMVPIIALVFLHKKTTPNIWVGAVMGIVGLYFISAKDGIGNINAGDAIIVLADVFWAIHILVVDKVGKEVRPLQYSMLQFLVCGVESLASALIFEDITAAAVQGAAISILYCGVLSVGVGYTLQVVSQRDADPTFASIIFSTESVFGALGGLIFGEAPLGAEGYIGCAIVFAGIVVTQLDFSKIFKRGKTA